MKEGLTINDFLEQKALMESKLVRAVSTAMFEFREATGLSPNQINIRLISNRSIGDPHNQYIVAGVETDVNITGA